MSESKQNPSRAQTVIVIVCGNVNKKEKEPLPAWSDLVAFENSIEAPLSVLWPHRRVPKKRLYRQWRMYASALRHFLLYLKAGQPISHGLSKAFYEVRACEERARRAMLDKVPPRKRGC